MKRSHAILYTVIVALLFAINYVINKTQEGQFDWTPDYSAYSKQPFGGYVLDKMLEASWEEGFSHEYKTVYRMLYEERLEDENLLILANHFNTSETDANALLDYVAQGRKVLIAASSFDNYEYRLRDTLHFHITSQGWLNYHLIKINTDTLKQHCELSLYPASPGEKPYKMPGLLVTSYFDSIPDNAEVLAVKNGDQPVAIQYSIGEGKLILCTHPTLFSNYGILSPQHEYVWGLLSHLNGAPLLRTEYYEVGYSDAERSQFRYILSQRPLRWAFYITLATLALLIVFTARRKQKAIPIVKKPDNQLMGFVRSMAALYLRKSNNGDILKKKYLIFAEQLQKDYHIDIINRSHDQALYEKVAQKTGSDIREVKSLFNGLDLLDSDFEINDKTLMDMVVRMDKIVKT